jgi:hypothetical protein
MISRMRPALVVTLVALVFAGPGLLPNRRLVPLDLLNDVDAWKPDPAVRAPVSNHLLSDPVFQFVPWDEAARSQIRAGQIPWSNRFAADGSPLFANPQAALFSPFTWPRLLFGLRGWGVTVFLKLVAAGLGAYWLARELGAGSAAALVSAAVYEISGYMIVWGLHPPSNVAAILPAFTASLLAWFRRASARRMAAMILLAALATAGGHPETLAVGVIGVFAFVGALSWKSRATSRHGLGTAAVAAFAGFLLLGVQLVPFFGLLIKSHVAAHRGIPGSIVTRWSAMIGQVLPGFLGSPLKGEIDISGIVRGSENFNMRSQGFVGATALVLAGLGFRRLLPAQRLALGIGAIGLFLAWQPPILRFVLTAWPLRLFSPQYWSIVFVLLAAPAIGSAALDVPETRRSRSAGLVLGIAGALLMVAAIAVFTPSGGIALESQIRSHVTSLRASGYLGHPMSVYAQRVPGYAAAARTTVLRRFGLAGAAWLIVGIGLIRKNHRSKMILTGLFLELASTTLGYLPAVRTSALPGPPPAVADLQRLDPERRWRILGIDDVFPPNLATLYRLRDFASYDVLESESLVSRWKTCGLEASTGRFPATLSASNLQLLAQEGVRYLISRRPVLGCDLVAGQAEPGVGLYEVPKAIENLVPRPVPPAGLAAGAAASAAGFLLAAGLVFGSSSLAFRQRRLPP